VAEVSTLH